MQSWWVLGAKSTISYKGLEPPWSLVPTGFLDQCPRIQRDDHVSSLFFLGRSSSITSKRQASGWVFSWVWVWATQREKSSPSSHHLSCTRTWGCLTQCRPWAASWGHCCHRTHVLMFLKESLLITSPLLPGVSFLPQWPALSAGAWRGGWWLHPPTPSSTHFPAVLSQYCRVQENFSSTCLMSHLILLDSTVTRFPLLLPHSYNKPCKSRLCPLALHSAHRARHNPWRGRVIGIYSVTQMSDSRYPYVVAP